jgi:hypothetical protein
MGLLTTSYTSLLVVMEAAMEATGATVAEKVAREARSLLEGSARERLPASKYPLDVFVL